LATLFADMVEMGSVVSATSTTQHWNTLSTSEAEYVEMADGVKNALSNPTIGGEGM